MTWTNGNVIQLIDSYKSKEILWNPSHRNYYNRLLKKDAWDELAIELQRPSEDLKKKWITCSRHFDEKNKKLCNRKPRLKNNLGMIDKAITSENQSFENEKAHRGQPSGHQPSRSQISESHTLSSQQRPRRYRSKCNLSKRVACSPKLKPTDPIKKKQKDPIMSEALELIQSSPRAATSAAFIASPQTSDSYQIYSNYLASKFRTYTHRTYLTVEHRINNILYSADNGQYELENGHQNSYSHMTPETISSNETVQISDHKEENIDYETKSRDSDD